MNVLKTLADLRAYQRKLEEAMIALEDLARRRSSGPARGRVQRSAATRERMTEAQRKRWAAYRKAKSGLPGKENSTAATKSQ